MDVRRVALVTGASRGIGRAIALELAALGHAMVVNYARSAEAADKVVAAITTSGGSAIAVAADVSRSDDRQRLVDRTLAEFGRIDVLVNNAGVSSAGRVDLLSATEESWDRVLGTNLKGPFFLSQLIARAMIACAADDNSRRPTSKVSRTIVNISSVSSFAVSTDRADYCIAKAGMRMMTQAFAARLADEGIGVFEICPGVIATDMTAAVTAKYDRLIDEGAWPIRRWGQPEDVAKAVAAVVMGAFPFSTGDTLHVDGGFHIRRF